MAEEGVRIVLVSKYFLWAKRKASDSAEGG